MEEKDKVIALFDSNSDENKKIALEMCNYIEGVEVGDLFFRHFEIGFNRLISRKERFEGFCFLIVILGLKIEFSESEGDIFIYLESNGERREIKLVDELEALDFEDDKKGLIFHAKDVFEGLVKENKFIKEFFKKVG